MSRLDLEEVVSLAATLRDPGNNCRSCVREMPGVLAPCLPNGDASHIFVERCDDCQRYAADNDAALAFAKHTELNAHKRYDDETLKYWRPFVSRPGDDDDHDCYAVGADEFGSFAVSELVIQPDLTGDLHGTLPR